MGADDGWGRAAYGGDGWSPRTSPHADELGTIWSACGVRSEWSRLRRVMLCRPGSELAVADTDAALYLAAPDVARAQAEHDALAAAYRADGIEVLAVPEVPAPTPNRMFCADLAVMTPEGAILARPASSVRAGEEVALAGALAAARVPILATLTGETCFEGADLIWLDRHAALLGRDLRTNGEGVAQVSAVLARIGVEAIPVDMPFGTMHLMGMLRIVAPNLALAWPRRTPHRAVEALRARGVDVAFLPEIEGVQANRGFNIVTLAPGRVLMPGGNPRVRSWYDAMGLDTVEVDMSELRKCAGAVGCLTLVILRDDGAQTPAPAR